MKIEALDIHGVNLDSTSVAYYRLPKDVKDFFQKCQKKNTIIGFEWDEESPWNFGVILGDK